MWAWSLDCQAWCNRIKYHCVVAVIKTTNTSRVVEPVLR